jgi:hypothetical protein
VTRAPSFIAWRLAPSSSWGRILWAAAARHIHRQDAASVLQRLAATSLWVSPAILREAQQALDALAL